MGKEFWLDTNVILRFLTQDHSQQAEQSSEIMAKADKGEIILLVDPLILAECCYVLTGKYYGLENDNVADLLTDFLESEGINAMQEEEMFTALKIYGDHKVDFPDAYLASLSSHDAKSIITFDQTDFKKLPAEYYTPQEINASFSE